MNREAREQSIIRGLLERIDDSDEVDQRTLADDLGIALGLTNAYVKRCVKKGWIKVNQVPARRYRYYLTPKGFAEKSRLTAQFLGDSLKFFRRARQSFDDLYREISNSGMRRIVLCGTDELTEIAHLCGTSHDLDMVGVLLPRDRGQAVAGLPVVDANAPPESALWVVASVEAAPELYRRACALAGPDQVAVPTILKPILRPEK